MKFAHYSSSFLLVLFILMISDGMVYAHSSGCHIWHSCPSDTGSYVCGDRGYCAQCPDNSYCTGGIFTLFSKKSSSAAQATITSAYVINDTNTTCRGNALCINSTVKKIVDGDTLDIGNYRVRLSLVNTPEYYQKGFAEASTFTKNFCKIGSKAIVDQDDLQPKDIYGRIVGVVYCGGKNLNENLLINNHATIIRYYCRTSEFSGDSWAKKYGC